MGCPAAAARAADGGCSAGRGASSASESATYAHDEPESRALADAEENATAPADAASTGWMMRGAQTRRIEVQTQSEKYLCHCNGAHCNCNGAHPVRWQ